VDAWSFTFGTSHELKVGMPLQVQSWGPKWSPNISVVDARMGFAGTVFDMYPTKDPISVGTIRPLDDQVKLNI